MPPKKKDIKGGNQGAGQALDEDVSDAGSLPLLNDFIFVNFYAFKYRRNRFNVEKALFQEFFVPLEGETAELAKRNRVIQISDLLTQAKAKGYLTEEEANNISEVDEIKLRQAFARATNEILASITLPLRRQKAELERTFLETLEKLSEEDKEKAKKIRFEKVQKELDLTCWLKDFPRTATDFQELRRSGAQHQPEIEVVIHGAFLIEENFKKDGDLDEESDAQKFGQKDSTVDLKEIEEAERKKAMELFPKEDRVKAFRDLAFINKFARNCPFNSQLRLLTAEKLSFYGPDPPMEIPEKETDETETAAIQQTQNANQKDKKGAAKEEEKPIEIPKSPEELAELKLFLEFTRSFRETVTQAEKDICEFRALNHPVYGIQKKPLWPKTFSKEEEEKIRQQKEQDEKTRKAQEAAEAEQKKLEEEAAKVASKGTKGKPIAKPEPVQAKGLPVKDARASLASAPSDSQSQRAISEQEKKEKVPEPITNSIDDRKVDWNFGTFQSIMNEMESSKTTVGSIMAAMIYQIEAQNPRFNDQKKKILEIHERAESSQRSHHVSAQMEYYPSTSSNMRERESQMKNIPVTNKDKFINELDDLFNKMAVEHAVNETDFHHTFSKIKYDKLLTNSPYQMMVNEQDRNGISGDAFTFLNGLTQGEYNINFLKTMQLPGINNRFKMPEKATRAKAERESDTAAILKFCPLEAHMANRMICLKHFEDLLHSENPERSYDFKKRNCTEELDASTFRQILCDSMRMNPDINTCYFDKDDALLLAINFKNPPGRLLRRQWTYPIKTMVDLPEFRKFIKGENLQMEQTCLEIQPNKVGVLRINQKYCFPCDNSVIRIDKYQSGSRRFGSSLVNKDNLLFGLKESQIELQEKVFGQDELLNMETKRSSHRNAELWVEFENKTRLHVAMFDKVEPDEQSIPALGSDMPSQPSVKSRVVVNESLVSLKSKQDEDDQLNSEMASRNNTALSGKTNESPVRQSAGLGQSQVGSLQDQVNKSLVKTSINDLQKQLTQGPPSLPAENSLQNLLVQDNYEPNQGASLTFTFNEGLVVQIKPNGDIEQINLNSQKKAKKTFSVIQEEQSEEDVEVQRTVTRSGVVIKTLKDSNRVIYFPDGTITKTDHRRGIWKTINIFGVVRERNLRLNTVKDSKNRLKIITKTDPETNASVEIREDGFLRIKYIDRRTLFIMPDNTQILITKSGPLEEGAAMTTTLVTKQDYAPVRIISDPVKARSNTIIGLGGTDALMGKDSIMERSNGGVISEVLLPDRTICQTYMEKQELPGYNKFSKSLIHLVRRDDFSIIKVRQDGEVVLITANERAYLNEIGKQNEFGKSDYDYFFELFGVPSERRSGVYTANLEQGRMWTQDEEGNYFMIYANGDSTEKLSVSFNLDQMVEGIENKEPRSPRVHEGEYIEEECKFLPPPKTVAEPRLFLVKANGATEFFSETQLDYLFRTYHKDSIISKSEKQVIIDNETAISHRFSKIQTEFIPEKPLTLPQDSIPKLPQCLEMVNQTVSIAQEPVKSTFMWRNIIQYKLPTDQEIESFNQAQKQKNEMRIGQAAMNKKLKIEPRVLNEQRNAVQNQIWLRIAKKKGVNVQTLLAEEYNQIKTIDKDQKRQKILNSLDDFFSPDRADQDTNSENNSDQ